MKILRNKVHHCTGSGIRCDKCDDVTIGQNAVYGNTWWTISASSAIVFAESEGFGTNKISGNFVYGNRNFMPMFLSGSMPQHGGAGIEHYGEWNQRVVMDGSGVYITRNVNY